MLKKKEGEEKSFCVPNRGERLEEGKHVKPFEGNMHCDAQSTGSNYQGTSPRAKKKKKRAVPPLLKRGPRIHVERRKKSSLLSGRFWQSL